MHGGGQMDDVNRSDKSNRCPLTEGVADGLVEGFADALLERPSNGCLVGAGAPCPEGDEDEQTRKRECAKQVSRLAAPATRAGLATGHAKKRARPIRLDESCLAVPTGESRC